MNKSLSELMAQNVGNSYVLRNKKGGFANPSIGLNYSNIPYQGTNNGGEIDRSFISQDISNRLLATETVSALPLLQKSTIYGTPSDVSQPFSYNNFKNGGNKKKQNPLKKQ